MLISVDQNTVLPLRCALQNGQIAMLHTLIASTVATTLTALNALGFSQRAGFVNAF